MILNIVMSVELISPLNLMLIMLKTIKMVTDLNFMAILNSLFQLMT